MGACCCCCKKEMSEEELKYESSIMFNGIQMIFKRGLTSKEQADVLVMSTDNYINNRSTTIIEEDNILQSINKEIKKSRGDNPSPLNNGDIIFSHPGLLTNVQEIAHLAVPIWRGGLFLEEKKITQGFLEILKKCEEKKMSTVMFTDITSGRFGIPKQVGINSLMNAIKEYLSQENSANQITTIKFVHRHKSIVILFEEFFTKDIGIKGKSADSVYSDHLKLAHSPTTHENQIPTQAETKEEQIQEPQDSNINKDQNIQ